VKFLCIVPIFNEESKLKTLLYEITLYSKKNKDVHFLLINNGSTDNSFNLLKLSGISLISFKKILVLALL
jgi:glycosyltransferase involved in cell wall biosynthesis